MSTASGSELRQQFQQSYTALKEYFSPSCPRDGASNPGQLVLFAEHAAKNGFSDIALECLQLYFNLNPPTNQFFIRAHLCKALITAPNSPTDETNMLQALDSIMKAVNIAKKSECYYFLVYNASVILWQICRPFQRPGSRKVFVKHLGSVVKALEECKEQDCAWRLELLIGLVLCQIDSGQKEDAIRTCSTAVQLAKKRVPNRLMEVLKMQVYNNLGEVKVVEKTSPEYSAIYRLYKIKCAIDHQGLSGSELEQKLQKAFTFIISGEESSSGRRTATGPPLSPPPKEARAPLLLELATLCVTHHLTSLAQDCVKEVPRENVQHDSKLMIMREVLVCQLMVQALGEAEELYTRSAVEVRLQAVTKMEETLTSTLRTGDAELIQSVCVAQWNLCLPLLQPNMRHQVLKPVSTVAKGLEKIESTLFQLRTVVHFELAKICADQNRLETAIDHLEKALCLDYYCEYTEQVKIYQNKLLLRAQLYKTPDDPVDQAAKIIEQVCSIPDAGSVEEQKALFVKAGELLAPNCFISTLSRAASPASTPVEDQPVQIQLDERTLAVLQSKGKKLKDYKHIKQKVEEHVKGLNDQSVRERCRTWANLAKATRTRGIWDVALAASMFCLQYENEGVQSQVSKTSTKSRISRAATPSDKQKEPITKKNSSPRLLVSEMLGLRQSSSKQLGKESTEREMKEMSRTLARVHCIMAECLVHELKDEGLNLGVKPHPSSIIIPTGTSIEDNELWKCYTDWAAIVTSDAHKSFLKAAELGCALGETWIVCNALTYIWNYNHHWVQENKLTEVVEVLRPLLETIKRTNLKDEGPLITQVCTALAGGLVQKWMPKPGVGNRTRTATAKKGRAESKAAKKGKSGRVSAAADQLQVDPDAGPELKEALEVCEYGMSVSVTSPLNTRGGLLAVWVQCKQLLQQAIPPKTFGLDESDDPCVQNCRAIVAVEMISRLGNKIWDFPNCPTLQEAHSLLSGCQWSDSLSEIELLVRLADIAIKNEQPNLVYQCTTTVIGIHKNELVSKNRKVDSDRRVENELLCLAHSFLGQCLSVTTADNVAITRKALEAFQDSARFGFDAGSYKLVIEACSHYWNTCVPLTNNQLERDLLREPLSELLELVASILEGIKKKEKGGAVGSTIEVEGQEKDHHLLVSMYGVVFQAYIDKQNWNDGLEAAEHAMWIMPKGVSRQLAQHKLLFKSRMGKNVEGDMVRFQEEPEEFIASLWYKAASNATDPTERLRAYQNAIQQLQSECHSWTKVEYLLEFSKWLYQQQFPVEDALKQLHQVVHILLNLREKVVDHQDTTLEGASLPPGNDNSVLSKPSLVGPSSKTPTQPQSGDGKKQDESGIKSIRQLEALMRVHIIMAQLHCNGSRDHWKLCIVALGYCIQIWKQIVQSLATRTEGGKSTASSFQLPNNPEQWAVFEVPEQLVEDVNTGSDCNSLSKHTIIKPMLTVHYLGILEKCLVAQGLHPLAFPVLNMQLAITECMVPDSKSFCRFLHMRMAELCTNMGLSSAAATHSDKVGDQILNLHDLARSRVEIEEYKAKKEAVKKVETKRSLTHQPSRTLKSATTTKRESQSPTKPVTKQKLCEYVVSDTLVVREVWVQQAMMLIQQGQYQSAREILNEALESCQIFDDQHTLLRVTFGLASLALAEGDSPQAIQLLTEAQKLPSQLDAWLDGVLLLSEAIWEDKDYVDQHSSVLNHLVSLLQSIVKGSRNEGPKVEYVSNILKFRLALCCIEEFLDKEGSQHSQVLIQCDIMHASAKVLHNRGQSREAAQIFIQLADILRSVATKFVSSEEDHQEYLLKALGHYQTAVDALSCVYEKAVSICQPSEEVTLPIQRELVNAQLLVAELLMEIFSEYSTELRTARTELQQKSSIEKLIDNYVRETPVLSFVAEEWKNTARLSVDRALSVLTSGHMLSRNDSVLKAKCTYLLGHCYHLLSVHTSPDYRLQWTKYTDDDKSCENAEAGGGEAGEDSDAAQETEGRESIQDDAIASGSENKALGGLNQYSALSSVMRKEDADQAENEETASLCFISQAVHFLTEATAVALNSGDWMLGMKTALEIIECCGVFDPETASQYLALYQSLAVAQEMNLHLRQILSDPRCSKLGSLFKQNHRLHQMHSTGPALQANINELMKFEIFRKLQVSEHHLDFIKSFPSHFRFVVLHHSPDKSRLYAAYLIPPQPPPPAPKKGQPPPEIELLEPVVACADVCFKDLLSLLDLMKDFQLDIGQKLLKFQSHTMKDLEYQFSDILSAMEVHLAGVLNPIGHALKKENSEKELCVVLLADNDLLQLPLEAITILNKKNIISVSRDFSLQMLSNRIAMFAPEDEGEVNKDKKKADKYQPQPTTLLGNVANFKYLLDPSGDLKTTEDTTTAVCSKILSTIQTHTKLTSKWSGHKGTEDHALNVSDWPAILRDCSGLVVFSTERILAHFSPSKLALLRLKECSMALLMDHMQTIGSSLRQSKLDYHKSDSEITFEQPVHSAMLLSLTGCGCVVANQWNTTVQSNVDKINSLLQGLLSQSNTVGSLVWTTTKETLSSTQQTEEEQPTETTEGVHKESNSSEQVEILDSESKLKDDCKHSVSAYNCVLYGLPHITLIASP